MTSLCICSGLYAYSEHTHQELVRKLSIRARNWCACWAYASGTDAYAQHTHQFSIFITVVRYRGPYKRCWAYAWGTGAHTEHTRQALMRMLSIRISSLRSACASETKCSLPTNHLPMKTLWCKNQENPSDRISHAWAPLRQKLILYPDSWEDGLYENLSSHWLTFIWWKNPAK